MLTNKEVRKKLRLEYIALILLVFGIAFAMLSSLNIPSWTVQSFDSGTVPIAPNSSNEHSFYTSFGPDLKKVEVIVDNGPWGMPSMWGDCVWIKKKFFSNVLVRWTRRICGDNN